VSRGVDASSEAVTEDYDGAEAEGSPVSDYGLPESSPVSDYGIPSPVSPPYEGEEPEYFHDAAAAALADQQEDFYDAPAAYHTPVSAEYALEAFAAADDGSQSYHPSDPAFSLDNASVTSEAAMYYNLTNDR
jgi:hypothetical protein